MLRAIRALSYLLYTIPGKIRLGLVILSFVLCFIIYMLVFPTSHNGTILLIPVSLSAWLYRQKGNILCISAAVIAITIYHALTLTLISWSPGLVASIIGGSLVLLVIGSLISHLRHMADVANVARDQAQEAEKQIKLAYEQQCQLNQSKDQFLLNINHELRTPLTGIHGYLELLAVHGDAMDEQARAMFLENALRCCQDLQLMVNDILDAAQSKDSIVPPKVEELAVADVVHDVLKQLDPRNLDDYTITLALVPELMIWADSHYVRQVLRNLLSNAFKYTPAHTKITISAFPVSEHQQAMQHSFNFSHICICVQDQGPGIPPEELPLLFEKFVRLKRDLSGKIRGTGLGLYVCKQLVEAMGGTIWVESTGVAGEGSRFCFSLPAVLHPYQHQFDLHQTISYNR